MGGGCQVLLYLLVPLAPKGAPVFIGHHLSEQILRRMRASHGQNTSQLIVHSHPQAQAGDSGLSWSTEDFRIGSSLVGVPGFQSLFTEGPNS